jgi:putative phosphoesterase
MSDTHGRRVLTRTAVTLFDALGVAHIIHCGDVGGMAVFDELAGRPFAFVWGNVDYADSVSSSLPAYLAAIGAEPPESIPLLLDIDGKRFAVFHGHEPAFKDAAFALDVDYILHGHTHVTRDERVNGRRIINPGALHLARPPTVATLNTTCDELTFHDLST